MKRKGSATAVILCVMAIFLLIFLIGTAPAVDQWKTANSITVSWDPVTTAEDGSPLPASSSIVYKVFIKKIMPPGSAPVEAASVPTTKATVTFREEGKYLIGVQALRMEVDTVVGSSIIAWSDDPAYVLDGKTFGAIYYLAPAPPKNIRSP